MIAEISQILKMSQRFIFTSITFELSTYIFTFLTKKATYGVAGKD